MLGLDHSSGINNNYVFPPINHEGLHTSSFHSHHEKLSQEVQPLSKLPSSQLNLSKLPSSELNVTQPWDLGFKFLHQYVICIHSWLRNYCVPSAGRGIISFLFSPHTALTTALLGLWYWRVQKQRQIREESVHLLIKIVRERDEVNSLV